MVMFIDKVVRYKETEKKEKNSENDQATYGSTKFGDFLNNRLHLVANNPKIWEPFKFWSKLPENEARAAVNGGTYPYIIVEPDKSTGGNKAGCFKPWHPDYIFIGRIEADEIKEGWDEFALPGLFKEMEATILHELVHWGRHKKLFDQPKFTEDGFTFDVGTKFEREAYPELKKHTFPVFMPTTTNYWGLE